MTQIEQPDNKTKDRFGTIQGFRWGFIGASGRGKTTVLRYMIKKMLNKTPYLIYDIESEFTDLGNVVKNVKELEEQIMDKKRHIVFQTEQLNFNGMIQEVAYISELFRTNPYFQGWIVIIDEAHNIYPKGKALSDDPDHASCIALFTQGRKRGISVIVATQRVSLINLTVLTQCNQLLCLGLTQLEVNKYFQGYEHAQKSVDLPEYHILNLQSGEILQPVELV